MFYYVSQFILIQSSSYLALSIVDPVFFFFAWLVLFDATCTANSSPLFLLS
jgi:hypothetical protein